LTLQETPDLAAIKNILTVTNYLTIIAATKDTAPHEYSALVESHAQARRAVSRQTRADFLYLVHGSEDVA
jgi:hypothetical protein